MEERKQILYLLGPVGGGKSSLAERLKALVETQPIYVLAVGDELSPVFESPLGLFRPETMGALLERQYKIPARKLTGVCSPWATKRLDELEAGSETRLEDPEARQQDEHQDHRRGRREAHDLVAPEALPGALEAECDEGDHSSVPARQSSL